MADSLISRAEGIGQNIDRTIGPLDHWTIFLDNFFGLFLDHFLDFFWINFGPFIGPFYRGGEIRPLVFGEVWEADLLLSEGWKTPYKITIFWGDHYQ